jgi:hypothetical protein
LEDHLIHESVDDHEQQGVQEPPYVSQIHVGITRFKSGFRSILDVIPVFPFRKPDVHRDYGNNDVQI